MNVMIEKINRVYIRTCSDTETSKVIVEWTSPNGTHGRTEGDITNEHMFPLLARAIREYVFIEGENR